MLIYVYLCLFIIIIGVYLCFINLESVFSPKNRGLRPEPPRGLRPARSEKTPRPTPLAF
jgi:hypothetical protein